MKPYRDPPMTLESAAAAHLRLVVWCKGCGHRSELDPAEQGRWYGPETPVPEWRRRLVRSLVLALICVYSVHVLGAPLAPGGTLVLLVPFKDGLIVGADSRTIVLNTACDYQTKILIPRRPNRTIATVTGIGVQVNNPSSEVTDICQYIGSAPRALDIEKTVTEYLERSNTDIENIKLEEPAQQCVDAVRNFQLAWPLANLQFAGQELFQVVLANYNPNSKLGHIRGFLVKLSAMLEPHYEQTESKEFSPQDPAGFTAAGEVNYLNQYVFRGVGRAFLSREAIRFLTEQRSAAEISRQEAVAVAIDIIEATSKTTALIPAPYGIGGPVDVVLLGDEARPEKLRWKTP